MTTLGELLGFAVPAVVGGLLGSRPSPAPSVLASLGFAATMVAAGAVEGAILGAAQAWVLGTYLPALRRRSWVGRTTLGAMMAWAIGMTPSTLIDSGVGKEVALPIGILLAPVLLVSIGVLQWTLLRHLVEKAGWWIPATAGAWLLGIALVFAAMALVDEQSPRHWVMGVAVISGLAMGFTAAALSGLALVWLLRASVGARST